MVNTLSHRRAENAENDPDSHFHKVSWAEGPKRTDGMRRPVSRGMRYAPNVRRARSTMKRRPAMKKISTVRVNGNMIFKGHKLTIGVDLGDRWSFYCFDRELA